LKVCFVVFAICTGASTMGRFSIFGLFQAGSLLIKVFQINSMIKTIKIFN